MTNEVKIHLMQDNVNWIALNVVAFALFRKYFSWNFLFSSSSKPQRSSNTKVSQNIYLYVIEMKFLNCVCIFMEQLQESEEL